MLDDIYKIADQIMELQKIAILQYTPIVDNIIRRKERDVDDICRTLDYVLDFAGTDGGLALFKRLCAYLYTLDQLAAVDYVEIYKNHYERDGEFEE